MAFGKLRDYVADKLKIKVSPKLSKVVSMIRNDVSSKKPNLTWQELLKESMDLFDKNIDKYKGNNILIYLKYNFK